MDRVLGISDMAGFWQCSDDVRKNGLVLGINTLYHDTMTTAMDVVVRQYQDNSHPPIHSLQECKYYYLTTLN